MKNDLYILSSIFSDYYSNKTHETFYFIQNEVIKKHRNRLKIIISTT